LTHIPCKFVKETLHTGTQTHIMDLVKKKRGQIGNKEIKTALQTSKKKTTVCMNINKFVFMVWFCNVDDAMQEQFCVRQATGHEIYRARLKKLFSCFIYWLEKRIYTQPYNVKSLWARTRQKEFRVCKSVHHHIFK
jgi:hypothetical protein